MLYSTYLKCLYTYLPMNYIYLKNIMNEYQIIMLILDINIGR